MDTPTGHDESLGTKAAEAVAPPPTSTYSFSLLEWAELYALRARYAQSHDLFSGSEVERLRFIRWLHTTGRLEA
jgi:hypothetical protein